MAQYKVRGPDGQVRVLEGPDGATDEQVAAVAQQTFGAPRASSAAPPADPPSALRRFLTSSDGTIMGPEGGKEGDGLRNFYGKNAVLGAVRGAAGIGATIMQPFQALEDKLTGRTSPTLSTLITGQAPQSSNQQTRQGIDGGLQELHADPTSIPFQSGKLAAEIAGTSGAGGVLGRTAQAFGAAPRLVNALTSAGFTTGVKAAPTLGGQATNLLLRMTGGAATGAASSGLINPDSAGTGAVIGGLLPPALRVAGATSNALARTVLGGQVAPEVADLARRAQALGIRVPADRIANSKPLNAVAAGLNYVPGSGRAATENTMTEGLDRALTRTFGQDSPNVTMALRKAEGDLGAKFDTTLKNNDVVFDRQLLDDVGAVQEKAARELPGSDLHVINGQIDELVRKGGTGELDGQAAYNIKKDLDRIGSGNTNAAYHARELKRVLMGALDRSLGPVQAAAFKTVREQYGNMLDLQGLAQNGAEGGISVSRLANMKNINNPQMQELADIAAQFVRPRESAHGASQRAFAGLGLSGLGYGAGGLAGGAAGLGGAMVAGRVTNSALNSNALRNLLLNPELESNGLNQLLELAGRGASRSLPRSASN